MGSRRIELIPNTYTEDEGYLCNGSPEPTKRSEDVQLWHNRLRWRVKVTFKGCNGITSRKNKAKRRASLEALIFLIDFDSIPLINDTVTELIIEEKNILSRDPLLPTKAKALSSAGSDTVTEVHSSWTYTVQGDDTRVRYLPFTKYSTLPHKAVTEIDLTKRFSGCVYLIRSDGSLYVYKTIERPFYRPYDSTTFELELNILLQLQGCSNIAQLKYLVVSPSPYLTDVDASEVGVICGMLLEFYPCGTLEDVIEQRDGRESSWRLWPKQIATALLALHGRGITHMDLAPRNVVLNEDNEAVLIDIGVGFTHELLAPEIRLELDPLGLPFETRCLQDVWSFGKLLLQLSNLDTEGFGNYLGFLGEQLSKEDPGSRMTLLEAVDLLQMVQRETF
ncbi:hypothetical protein CFD26_100322 [Aspergillus turcosus]|uniref:EKC/KEOPS complex subunit BUD32 n=1 Tax=Aspergillus turcosus TaxID=1245748 RepID=A0A421CUN8_9EURO|nr:hypothetical protein CFD26_100322 [Aspergillus turcosus]